MSRLILEQLETAEQSLRENLQRRDLHPKARMHMQRALSHVRKAYFASVQINKLPTSKPGPPLNQ